MRYPKRSDRRVLRLLESLADTCLIIAGYLISYFFRYGLHPERSHVQPYLDQIPFVVVVSLLLLLSCRLHIDSLGGRLELASRLGCMLLLLTFLAISATFWMKGFVFPRRIILIAFIVQFMLLYFWKSYWLRRFWDHQPIRKVMVVGPENEIAQTIASLRRSSRLGLSVAGSTSNTPDEVESGLEHLRTIVLCSGLSGLLREQWIKWCMETGRELYVFPAMHELIFSKANLVYLDDSAAMHLPDLALSREQEFFKRLMDVSLGGVFFLFSLAPITILAFMIRLYDGGPAFFRQTRLTKAGKTFTIYKLRTMIHEAEKKTGPVLSSPHDPRLLPFGRWMRACRLDELPQLLNVIKGEMSLVGPRPERPERAEILEEEVPGFSLRLAVKAGLTGLAQVRGHYDTSPRDKLNLDLIYIRRHSISLDLWILFQTLRVFSSEGFVQRDVSISPLSDEGEG